MEEVRESYASGKTRSYEWRVSQLKNLLKLSSDHEQDIVDALRSDISKPELESVVYEVPLSFYIFIKGKRKIISRFSSKLCFNFYVFFF